jgi:eukaryotic-like serine/threonine-protein kinase
MSDPEDKPPENEPPRTVFMPREQMPLPDAPAPPQQTSLPVGGFQTSFAPRTDGQRIQIGDVLNHIFEVKRFIARGGMGEVFEGINVNSDERVAIKVILPALAADPNVQAMFRKEARTLTRLSHPALVQYRVLAQEPQLGVFYIVTEYVDGCNLSDVLSDLNPTADDLFALTRRLAEGLRAAHALGAIHRDISPDNVLLEGSQLAGARVIDFGIAKDLDPGSATIIGDGFAGKLNYVAPEQLGDFDRLIGPWSDVYSLGLVILAVAMKRNVDMGATPVDAVDKRRSGPDLSPLPTELQPIVGRMLTANPADRLRSMDEVIDMLPGGTGVSARPVAPIAVPASAPKPPRAPIKLPAFAAHPKFPLFAGGGAIALVSIVGLIFAFSGGDEKPPVDVAPPAVATAEVPGPGVPPADPVEAARTAVNAKLPSVNCSWLDISKITNGPEGLTIAMTGVAGKPAEAQGEIARAAAAGNLRVAAIDFEDVAPIQPSECAPLEAFRQIRDPLGKHIEVAQRSFEMSKISGGKEDGMIGAVAVVTIRLGDSSTDLSLFGIEPSGEISQVFGDRAVLTAPNNGVEVLGDNARRLKINVTHQGWSGLLLLTGKKPFDEALVAGPPGSRDATWPQRFAATAAQRGWKSEMVWFKTVDTQPN